MKSLFRAALIAYTLLLLWLVLFKTSLDIPSVLADLQTRSLNFIPFTGHLSEIVENVLIFIPFGFLIGAVFKEVRFWKKLVFISLFSIAIEATQYILAIGVSDITDFITNSFGGLLGLAAYKIGVGRADSERRKFIALLIVAVLIIACLYLRFFVFRVKY